MHSTIRPRHPLRILFSELVHRNLTHQLRLSAPGVSEYIAGLLVDFTVTENLYCIRDARGRRLEDVGEMLIASNPMLEGRSFDYERLVRKHIGDYTLFLTGLFPEYVARLPRRQVRLDAFVDYMKAGKESYGVVAAFNQFEYSREAPLFAALSDQFELCVFGLNQVKNDLKMLQRGYYQSLHDILECASQST